MHLTTFLEVRLTELLTEKLTKFAFNVINPVIFFIGF